jgi:hypothetical protein
MRSAWFTCPLSSLSSSRSHAALTYEFSCLWRPPRSPPPPWAPLARCLGGCGLPTRARHCSEQPRRRCNVLPASGCLGFHDRARAVAAARWQIPLPVPPRPTNLHAVRQDDSPWRLAHARAAMTAMAAGDWVDSRTRLGTHPWTRAPWGGGGLGQNSQTAGERHRRQYILRATRSCYLHTSSREASTAYPLAGATIASIDHIDHR